MDCRATRLAESPAPADPCTFLAPTPALARLLHWGWTLRANQHAPWETRWEVRIVWRLMFLLSVLALVVAVNSASASDYSPLFAARLEATLESWDRPTQPIDSTGGEEPDLVPSVLPPWSVCVGSICVGSVCAGSICLGSGCSGSTCVGSACVMSGCLISGCVGETLCAKKCGGDGPPNIVDPSLPGSVTFWPACPEN